MGAIMISIDYKQVGDIAEATLKVESHDQEHDELLAEIERFIKALPIRPTVVRG